MLRSDLDIFICSDDGFSAFPAAIGAKVAAPQKTVVDIDGDASFSMTAMELATASQYGHRRQGSRVQQRIPRNGAAMAGYVTPAS